MRRIPLTQGKVAIVDDDDFERLKQWKWSADRDGNTFYAKRSSPQKLGRRYPILMHREILGLKIGDDRLTDHVNRQGLDNRRCNLRIVTFQQNAFNRRRRKSSSSKFKGVFWKRVGGKWQSQITLNGRHIFLGYFTNEAQAAKVYDRAALKYFGEFARLNFADGEAISTCI